MHNRQPTVTESIKDFVIHHPGCLLEDMVRGCPDLSWNQVFLEVDRLSRIGQVRLNRKVTGGYTLSVPRHERPEV